MYLFCGGFWAAGGRTELWLHFTWDNLLHILFGEEAFSHPIQHALPERAAEAICRQSAWHCAGAVVDGWSCSSLGSVNENQRPSNSYNGDLNGLLVPDPIVAADGPSLAKPAHRSAALGALQEKQVM